MIYDSYIDRFGVNKDYQRILNLQAKIAKAQNGYILTKNKRHENEINIFSYELEKLLQTSGKGMTTDQILTVIAKHRGLVKIDSKQITVVDFHIMKEDYERCN